MGKDNFDKGEIRDFDISVIYVLHSVNKQLNILQDSTYLFTSEITFCISEKKSLEYISII